MDLGLRDRVALVTGASSGIGEAVALALAAEGARVALAARREERLQRVALDARKAGAPDARAFQADLSDPASIAALVKRVQSEYGRIDILIANGGGPKPGTFLDLSIDDWDAGYRATLRSMLQLIDAVVPEMTAQGFGRIVALTSTSVKQPIAHLALSNAFRTALVSALKTLSGEVASKGVTVNAIATGRVRTQRLLELYDSEEDIDRAARAEVPIGRVAEPAEFAPMVVFLCSERAGYVTGQTIAVDGGLIKALY